MNNYMTKVVLFFVFASLVVGYVASLAFSEIFLYFSVPDQPLIGSRITLSTFCGLSFGLFLGFVTGVLYRKSRTYIENVVVEVDKVAWPSWNETRVATVTVIVTCFIAAAILGVFDLFFGWLMHNNLFLL